MQCPATVGISFIVITIIFGPVFILRSTKCLLMRLISKLVTGRVFAFPLPLIILLPFPDT